MEETLLRLTELLHATVSILDDMRRSQAETGGREAAQRPLHSAGSHTKMAAVPAANTSGCVVTSAGGAMTAGSDVTSGPSVGQPNDSASSALRPSPPGDSCLQPSNAASSALRPSPPSDSAANAKPASAGLPGNERLAHVQQRLPELKAFSSEGGEWAAFERRFVSLIETSGWSEYEALQSLPAMLDDDALAALLVVPRAKRATLTDALHQMRLIYGSPSEARHRFDARRKKAFESAMGYRSALLAMARVAYPRMDEDAVESLVLQKLMSLARQLRVAMPTADDDDFTSLRAARCIQAHLHCDEDTTIAACAGPPDAQAYDVYSGPHQAFTATQNRGSSNWRSQRDHHQRDRPISRQDGASIVCHNCGLRGHVASGCRVPRCRTSGPPAPWPPPYPRHTQASHDTSHSRPPLTTSTHPHTTQGGHASKEGDSGPSLNNRALGPGQWSELAHRVVAAAAGSSAVVGSIEGVDVRMLIDTGASATIISDIIYNILPDTCRPLQPVDVPCYAANGGSLGITGQINAQIRIADVQLVGPILVSSTLAVPCLLGTDFLGKTLIKILINKGCIELPSGRRMAFLPTPTRLHSASTTVQALAACTIHIPPGSQMLVPLRFRKPLDYNAFMGGAVIGPSRSAERVSDLVCAQTLVRSDHDPFIQVLNAGLETTVICQGMVLAHATPAPPEDVIVGHVGGESSSVAKPGPDTGWLDALCSTSADLSPLQHAKLRTLLSDFADVFSQSKFDIGCTKLLSHHIDTGDAAPIRQNPFRLSPAEKEHVRVAVNDMLAADVIAPSNSPWGAPIVLVKKHDGSLRFCVDFRKLNKISVADAYPLPRMDESLDALAGAHYFSTLDLLSGFWQLPLDDASKPKTAFRTPQGLFQFNRLPMGLHSAPATFQRLMELVLAGLQWDSCLIYLDVVIVFSKTFDEHLTRLKAVFLKM
ncbi:uncharacterized protein LOC144737738 [Lampetra planeri]